jgi:hypothetical protein
VPLKERPWADNRGTTFQPIPSKLLGFGCQPATLVVVEAGLFAQLFPENSHLLLEVFDDHLLVAVEPARKAEQDQL